MNSVSSIIKSVNNLSCEQAAQVLIALNNKIIDALEEKYADEEISSPILELPFESTVKLRGTLDHIIQHNSELDVNMLQQSQSFDAQIAWD